MIILDFLQVYFLVAIGFPDYGNAVEPGPVAQVAGIGNGLEQCHPSVLGGEGSGVTDGAKHSVLEIEEIDVDHRGLDVVPVDDPGLDKVRYLTESQAFYVKCTENRKFDVSVLVHPVARVAGTARLDRTVSRHGIRSALDIERHRQFHLLACHGDGQPSDAW